MDVILISLHVTCILHDIAEKFGIKQQSFTLYNMSGCLNI
jgi:hypothetical protein